MIDLQAVWALTWRDLRRASRDRRRAAAEIVRPAMFLLLLGQGLKASGAQAPGIDYQQFMFAGVLALTITFAALVQGVTILWDREFGFLKEVLVAPISRATIVVGKIVAGATVSVAYGALTLVFAPVVSVRLTVGSVVSLLAVFMLLAVAITALGMILAMIMKTLEGFSVVFSFVNLPLTFLSGGMFPMDGVPTWMTRLIHANPVTYGVDLMRHALGQPTSFDAVTDVAVGVAFAGVMITLVMVLFRRE